MTQKLILSIALVSGLFLSSCVSSKKYKATNAQLELSNSLLKQANTEIQQLKAANGELTAKVDKLGADNKVVSQEYSQFKASCEASNQKLAAFETAAKQDDEALREMEKKLEEALANFMDKGVEVYAKDRFIYINMQDNLLYKSGSAALGKEGKAALGAVAAALNDYPDLKVVVVGNTDNQKFKNSHTDNMSLSTERANGVVRVLRDDYKVEATRLTAAGQGKYNPVADNATAEGRAKNRRTEIILRPDLLKLYQSLR